MPYPNDKRASYVDYRDVAEVAAIALTTDKLDYGTFEFSAPGMFNRVELTHIMSGVLGRTIKPVEITFDEWVTRNHVPEGAFREGMESMYAEYAKYGFPGGNALVLRAILGGERRTLKAFLKGSKNKRTDKTRTPTTKAFTECCAHARNREPGIPLSQQGHR